MKKLLVVLALLVIATAAQANLLVNSSFDQGLTGWTIWNLPGYGNPSTVGTMTTRANGDLFFPPANDGNYASSQIGYANALGGAYQTISVPNGAYKVGGWLAGGAQGGGGYWELKAWDGAFPGGEGNDGVTLVANTPVFTYGESIVNVTTGQLTVGWKVGQYWAGLVGGHVDNVSVAAVPEPSSLVALFSGLAGMAGLVIRRKH